MVAKYSDKLYTIRKSDEINDKLTYLSDKLSLTPTSIFRLGVCLLYEEYGENDEKVVKLK